MTLVPVQLNCRFIRCKKYWYLIAVISVNSGDQQNGSWCVFLLLVLLLFGFHEWQEWSILLPAQRILVEVEFRCRLKN